MIVKALQNCGAWCMVRGGRAIMGCLWLSVSLNLACSLSIGELIVQAPTPTETPIRTRRATYTPTRIHTPTFTPTSTPTPTATPTQTPTETSTPTPTNTPPPTDEPTATRAPVRVQQPISPLPQPTTPPEPTATPAPTYPFSAVYSVHDTGSPGETRMTAWVRLDYEPGKFQTLSGFQMKVTAPDGTVHLSEASGSGTADSTSPGTGDNHRMNSKLEIRPYTPGSYKVMLIENGNQVSPEIQLDLSAAPLQYIHFDFFKQG